MSDTYAASQEWRDWDDLPGWKVRAVPFRYERTVGVAIWNGESGPACVRHAIRTSKGVLDEATALKQCLPILKEWASA